jgi:glycosyltransferase involved in cell wall biosynthesis
MSAVGGQVGPPSSPLLAKLLRGLERLGVSAGPWLERQRARLNRPALHAIAREAAERAAILERHQAENARLAGALEAAAAEARALRGAILALRDDARREVAEIATGLEARVTAQEAAHRSLLEGRVRALEVLALHAARQTLGVLPLDADAAPEVSVVMPVRDRAEQIGHAIRSVLAQDGVAWELLIADDGSTDSLEAALAPFRDDPRIRVLQLPPRGPSAARNAALAAARGGLVAYLDSDNAWFPGFLASAAAAFRADPALRAAYGMLVAEEPIFDGSGLLWDQFDADRMAEHNFIDLNAYVHRRDLLEAAGGFDPGMTRLVDWDLIQRHSELAPPRRLDVPAVAYRTRGVDRVTATQLAGPNVFTVRRKQRERRRGAGRRPRVLYALWHYPQITESYIETEIRAMLRLGAEIEVWSEREVAAWSEPAVAVHRGTLEAAIAAFRPDLVHVHWLGSAGIYAPAVAAAGLPLTVRAHGFEMGPDAVAQALALPGLVRAYLFPSMDAGTFAADPRIRRIPAIFDTVLFRPALETKDRRMVLRTAAALPSKQLDLFLDCAAALPEHRFILVAGTCLDMEHVPDELRAMNAARGNPAELRFDVPRPEVARLMAQAGLYLHTALPPEAPGSTPYGAPVSIVEAMATGAVPLVRDQPAFRALVGDAGRTYATAAEAIALIRATADWSDTAWRRAGVAAVEQAWPRHCDELAVAPIYDDWCAIAERVHQRSSVTETA